METSYEWLFTEDDEERKLPYKLTPSGALAWASANPGKQLRMDPLPWQEWLGASAAGQSDPVTRQAPQSAMSKTMRDILRSNLPILVQRRNYWIERGNAATSPEEAERANSFITQYWEDIVRTEDQLDGLDE